MVKFGISRKKFSCYDHQFSGIYDKIKEAFKSFMLLQNFKIRFIHEEFDELIDLASPILLMERINTSLYT